MNTPHPHAEFIAEAVKDMSRGISKVRQSGMYEAVSLSDVINDSRGEFIFFFDETPPLKPKITLPLTQKEWIRAYHANPKEDGLMAVAIAAKIATLKEVAAMPSETTLTDGELVELTPMGGSSLSEIRRNVANAAIAKFQATLLAGIGETK